MNQNQIEELKIGTQEIIDLIAQKNLQLASQKLADLSDKLDDLIDTTDHDKDLIEISKYQVLLNQLFQKMNSIN